MISEQVQAVVRTHVPDASPDSPIDPRTTLVDLGIDSLRLVELIISLEESFDIVIPDEEMSAENFDTVGAVTGLVSRILSEA